MRVIADATKVDSLIGQLAVDISRTMDRAGEGDAWALVGIRDRGDELARRIAQKIGEKRFLGVGSLDITLYRDDLSEIGSQAVVQTSDIPFSIDAVHVVLIDDVLMTGRSIRAAMESLIDLGRPKRVWLAALVDRGGRELPICPDFVGLNLSQEKLGAGEHVAVEVTPRDERDAIAVEGGK